MKRLLLFFSFAIAAIGQNAVMLPWVPQQFTNTNGTILVSGKVCTYQAGTSTGLATFTDATATVSNSVPPNAILLDSTARPTSGGIWLTPGKAYKIVTMTAGSDGTCNTGVVVKTQDNVVAAGNTFGLLNGCVYVTGSQTFAQALAAVSNPGCIEVTPGTYSVLTNATIPAGVTLRSTSGGLLNITNAVTLTINGPIIAPAQQLFTYTGSGTVALGIGVNPIRAIWFPGSDFHVKLQNAYNALPAAPSAGRIIADPNPAGGCWVTTTTASLNVANKYANIVVESPTSPNVPQQGFCDNFTPTITGSAVSISAISVAANLVTVTCSATCTTGWTGGGGSTATIVTIRGVTVPDYNGVWPVQTVTDGTHFTFNSGIGSPAASSGGTVAQSPYAIELDWTPSNGGGYDPTAGMQGYVLENNGCTTNGGCGSYAVGLLLSRTNAGIHASPMYNDLIEGFGTGVAKINTVNCQTGWGTNWAAVSLAWNNTGFFVGCANENESWSGNAKIAQNGTGFQMAGSGAEISFFAGSFDSNTLCGVQMDVGTIWHSTDVHYENNGTAPTTYICSTAVNSIIDIVGGIAYDDGNGAGNNNWFQAGYINVSSMSLSSQKAYPSQWVFAAGTRGKVDVINTTPANLPNIIFGNGGTNILINVQNPTSSLYTPVLGIGEIATPSGFAALGQDICYADSTAHGLKCSFNNGSYGPLVTAAPCTTSQKTESAADANLLTCAIPAQAGSYRVRFALSVSAANAATLGWTVTYTNSNGAAEAPTNLALFQLGTAAPALTFTTSSQGDWHGSADVEVNNAGTAIVVKLTFSGTSFTGKASATVERII